MPSLRLELNIMKFSHLLHAALIALSIMLVSCERQKILLREKEKLEAEYKNTMDEIQTIEQRMLSLGTQVSTASYALERQAATAEQKAQTLEAEVAALENKAQTLANATKEFSSRVDTFKSKYLR